MEKVLWIKEQYLIPRSKRSWQRTFLLLYAICFQMARCEMSVFFLDLAIQPSRNSKKSWPLTHPSTTMLWFSLIYLKPCLKLSFLRPAGVKSLCERSFLMLPSLQSQASAKPRNRLDQVYQELMSQDHTADQKTGQSKIACCRREKSVSRLTT